jgi:hypothetical protein
MGMGKLFNRADWHKTDLEISINSCNFDVKLNQSEETNAHTSASLSVFCKKEKMETNGLP